MLKRADLWLFMPVEIVLHIVTTTALLVVVLLVSGVKIARSIATRRRLERPPHIALLSGLQVVGSYFWMMFPLRGLRRQLQMLEQTENRRKG